METMQTMKKEHVPHHHVDYSRGIDGKKKVFMWDVLEVEGLQKILQIVDGVEYYDQRSLIMAANDELVLVGVDVDKDYLGYINSIGFGPKEENIVVLGREKEDTRPLSHKILETDELLVHISQKVKDRNDNEMILHSYYYSDEAMKLAEKLGLGYMGSSTNTIKRFNDKTYFKEFCRDQGMDVAEGKVVPRTDNKDLEDRLRDSLQKQDKLFIRGNRGASASSTYLCTESNVEEISKKLAEDVDMDSFLVEKMYDVEQSPSLLYRLTDDEAQRLSPLSGQILDSSKEHMGNFYPAHVDEGHQLEILEKSEKIAEEMRKQGYRGELGYDWMISKEGKIMPAECNPRVTGQTTLAYLYSRLKKRHGPVYVASFNVHSDERSFRALEDVLRFKHLSPGELRGSLAYHNMTGSLMYDGQHPSGVIPTNFGPFRLNGKCNLVVLNNSKEELDRMVSEVTSRVDKNALEYVSDIYGAY